MCWEAWIWTFTKGPNPHIKLHTVNIPILAVHSISNSEFPKLDSISRLPSHEWTFSCFNCSGLCSHGSRKRINRKKETHLKLFLSVTIQSLMHQATWVSLKSVLSTGPVLAVLLHLTSMASGSVFSNEIACSAHGLTSVGG